LVEVQTILKSMGIDYTEPIGVCKAAKEKRIYID
jgi:hypothetical protein